MRLHVLTMNTHKGFTALNRRFMLHELREAVRAVDADLLFLQEVQGEHAVHGTRHSRWPEEPHYEFLADSLWTDYAYGRNAVYPEGHHGNAVLSKFPIVRHHNLDVSVPGTHPRRHEPRGLLHCVLQLPQGEREPLGLHAVCVHLGLRAAHRARQVQLLAQLLADQVPPDAPLVVAGDFNDWRGVAHRSLQAMGLHEVFVHAYGEPARTFPARWPLLRLDRIYVRQLRSHAPLVLPRKPWSHLSDHAPLAAELSL